MDNTKKVPVLRFPEFSDEWEVKNIEDIFNFKNGLNKEKEYFGKGTPIINFKDVYNGGCLTSNNIQGLVEVDKKEINNFLCKKGDVFFTRTSETINDIGMSATLMEDIPNCVFSGFVLRAKPKNNHLVDLFKVYCFSTPSIRNEITKKSSYTTRALTSGTLLNKVIIKYPGIKEEQQKIADFLSKIDNRIENLTKKKQLLESYKKGVMQKIFSQELRFKDDKSNDYPDWEVNEFIDLVNKSSSKYDPAKENKIYRCIELESLSQETGILLETFNSKEMKSIKNKFHKGEILFGKLRPYLKKYLKADFDGVCSSEIWVFKGIKVINNFLYYLIQTSRFNYIANVSSGSKMPRSDWEYVSSSPFHYPIKQEQTKIANFLTEIDNKINLVSKQIEVTKKYKKGLIQQMFV